MNGTSGASAEAIASAFRPLNCGRLKSEMMRLGLEIGERGAQFALRFDTAPRAGDARGPDAPDFELGVGRNIFDDQYAQFWIHSSLPPWEWSPSIRRVAFNWEQLLM